MATTHALEVGGTIEVVQYKVYALNTASANAADTGFVDEIRMTATHIFICTATNV